MVDITFQIDRNIRKLMQKIKQMCICCCIFFTWQDAGAYFVQINFDKGHLGRATVPQSSEGLSG